MGSSRSAILSVVIVVSSLVVEIGNRTVPAIRNEPRLIRPAALSGSYTTSRAAKRSWRTDLSKILAEGRHFWQSPNKPHFACML